MKSLRPVTSSSPRSGSVRANRYRRVRYIEAVYRWSVRLSVGRRPVNSLAVYISCIHRPFFGPCAHSSDCFCDADGNSDNWDRQFERSDGDQEADVSLKGQ